VTVLIDSDILIEVARGRDAEILGRWEDLANSNHVLLCSPVSVAELWHDARSKEYEALTSLFRVLSCVPADGHVGMRAGEYLRQSGRSDGLELGDALIAAAAVLSGAALWTRNRKHYPMKELSFY
jgi:predicted nucleic acid-binding protein